jgi:hypothetical protein
MTISAGLTGILPSTANSCVRQTKRCCRIVGMLHC